ncbi:MAG: phosphate acetyltransferase [bacterium (Candidatus Ratteibacteria) CG23_combo_of_CG06-09_8_20_14_all_48_7]|uniref:Phosphate acetyltransferase n=1 Tax=bacterium (Candidatus Ratteibacteria) CG23_combo_of_CG06-09_8_20_14_all_48_7 TaxID=2014292 RepID=A0A2G9YAK2_9BACT|nr:MAG: phosphate acetyltransferase [bacterium (Candidatus Ratteibacteria) CG23_combo_of_CG06-09_8_20_14_all_48_7]
MTLTKYGFLVYYIIIMDLIAELAEKVKKNPKRIVFPEGDNPEIQSAVNNLAKDRVVKPIVLVKTSGSFSFAEGVSVLEPEKEQERLKKFSEGYARKHQTSPKVAEKLCRRNIFFGAMMVAEGEADGMVAGIDSATAIVLQSAALAVGLAPQSSIPSSFFVMHFGELFGEKDKVLIYADCAATIEPDSQQLAEIGVTTARNSQRLLGFEPRVAFLSFSTKGSANHTRTEKVVKAVEIARSMAPEIMFDGELQADAALIPRVANKKAPDSPVAGKANVLVFPDLDSGNIAYKLTQYLAGASAYGPIIQGFRRPVNDLSRGAKAKDIYGVAIITALLA